MTIRYYNHEQNRMKLTISRINRESNTLLGDAAAGATQSLRLTQDLATNLVEVLQLMVTCVIKHRLLCNVQHTLAKFSDE